MIKGKEIIVFDVCDTLYYSNTTFDFLGFLFSNNWFKKTLFWFYTTKYSPVFVFLVVLSKLLKEDFVKKKSLKLLKGYPKSALESQAVVFVEDVLETKKVRETQRLLQEAIKSSKEVVLLSASIDVVVQAIARRLHVKSESSLLAYENGVCLGYLKSDLSGKKRDYLALDLIDELTVYSDNYTDLSLLKAATNAVGVVCSEEQERFWRKQKIDVLKVGCD